MIRIEGDRLVAFLIIDGKVYSSDRDHQDCLVQYRADNNQKQLFTTDPETREYAAESKEAIHTTYDMKCNHEQQEMEQKQNNAHF